MKKRILIISYWFLPSKSVAAKRVNAYFQYFNKQKDFEVTLFCPDWGELPFGNSSNIVRPISFSYSFNYYPKKKEKESFYHRIKELILYKVIRIQVFLQFFRPEFYRKGKLFLADLDLKSYDYLVTSYGPVDVFYLGEFVKKMNPNIKWVADYRDHMSLNYTNKLGIWRPIIRVVEKKMIKLMDTVIVVSETMKTQLLEVFQNQVHVIYNGYQPESESLNFGQLKKKYTIHSEYILYTGSIYNGRKDLTPFLSFVNSSLELRTKQFVFATNTPEDFEYLTHQKKIFPDLNFVFLTDLNHNETICLQKNAFALLLVLSLKGFDREAIPVKFYEYLYAQRPIIYSGTTINCEVYGMMRKLNAGEHYSKFQSKNYSVNPDEIKQFNRREQSEKFAEIIRKM